MIVASGSRAALLCGVSGIFILLIVEYGTKNLWKMIVGSVIFGFGIYALFINFDDLGFEIQNLFQEFCL